MSSSDTLCAADKTECLPLSALLALAMTGFICIITETMPAGLLPQIASGLQVSNALAGQTITSYALGSLIAAIPLTIATQGWRRRRVLLLTILGFLLFNSLTAWSSNYWLTLAARFFAGMAAGLAWSLLAGYARRMVAPHQQGRAMAVAMLGAPVALSIGVPLGTWLGTFSGWRTAFIIISALTLLLVVWVLTKVPDYPGQSRQQRLPLRAVFSLPGVRPVLGVVIGWMLAHNILYTYIAPFVEAAGMGNQVDVLLLIFGLAALAGIAITGKLVEHWLRISVLSSLALFALTSLMMALFSGWPAVIYGGIALWGLTFGGAATLLQTALADTAGDGADVALSMNVVAWNGAIAGAGVAGGVLLDSWGIASLPFALPPLLAVAFVVAWSARAHGFTPGSRRHRP